jgi:hypothetical protein
MCKYFLQNKKITTPKMRHQTTKSKAFLNLEGSKILKTIHATTLKTPSALKQANIEDKNSFLF